MFDSTDGTWDTVWPLATPFENKQRTVTFGGTLATLGAGETTGFLLRNDSAEGFPAGSTTAPHEGETIVLGSAGTFSLDATLDWDRDVSWNWVRGAKRRYPSVLFPACFDLEDIYETGTSI